MPIENIIGRIPFARLSQRKESDYNKLYSAIGVFSITNSPYASTLTDVLRHEQESIKNEANARGDSVIFPWIFSPIIPLVISFMSESLPAVLSTGLISFVIAELAVGLLAFTKERVHAINRTEGLLNTIEHSTQGNPVHERIFGNNITNLNKQFNIVQLL